jgi:hypothetical protein
MHQPSAGPANCLCRLRTQESRTFNAASTRNERIFGTSFRHRRHSRLAMRLALRVVGRAMDPGGNDPRFEHGLHRWNGGQCRAASAAAATERQPRRRPVGDRSVCAVPRRVAARRRRGRRPFRAPARVPARSGAIRHLLPRMRTRRQCARARLRSRSAGYRRRAADPRQPGDHQRVVCRA